MKKFICILLSFTMLFSIAAGMNLQAMASTEVWELESNDYPNEANDLHFNETMLGYLPAGDKDCFIITSEKDIRFQIVFNHDINYEVICGWALQLYQYNEEYKEWYDVKNKSPYKTYQWYPYEQITSSDGISYSNVINMRAGEQYMFELRPMYGGDGQGQVQYQVSLREYKQGWEKVKGKWYYYANNKKVTGWKKIGGKWYLFAYADGRMLTGWVKSGSKWYYMNPSGAMVTGWKKIGNIWYWFNTSGAMQTGWKKIGGAWYYFNSSGSMRTADLKQGGKTYRFRSSGACINP